jgi:signal transduction histidine kinase
MKEVSCRFFEVPVRDLRERGIDVGRLVAGTPYTAADLANKDERIEWSALVRMMENARALWTRDELLRLGARTTEGALVQFIGVVARIRFSLQGFYQWVAGPDGPANQMITSMTTTNRVEGPGRIVVEFEMLPGNAPSEEFFLITQGTYMAMPRMMGAQPANVRMEMLATGARFHIEFTEPKGVLASLRRTVTRPFTMRQAAKELTEAHSSLLARYRELDATRAKLEAYQVGLEKLVDERTAELREAQSARDRFFENVSHEIRTPLSLILLAAGDIDARAHEVLDERAQKSLGSISDGAKKLVRLVDDLLLLAAGQEDKLRLHPEPTDVAVLVDHAIAAWRPAAEAAGLDLGRSGLTTVVMSVDPVAVERVVSNLLSNAMKYTPRGGRVDVAIADEPDGVRLSVLDTGLGVDEELAGRLFGRFERSAGESRRKQGIGIGLSLVKELVEGHGGKVSAHPRATGGTEMRVVFPPKLVLRDTVLPALRPRGYTPTADAPGTIASGTRLAPPGVSAGTILLAEDDAQLADAISRLLAEEYTVVVGLDGQAAADLIAANQPHLLVTDVDMPRMNGIELAKRFREVTGDKLAPIIILSAVLDLGTRVAGLEAGAIDYVTKPFDPTELRARVRAQFRMREMALRLHRAEQLSAMGILVSGLAHEIRNPANGISNAVGPLKGLLPADLKQSDSGVAQLLDVLTHCAGQITAMSKQLLSFRNGGNAIEMRPAKIPELVDRAITVAAGALHGVEMRKQIDVPAAVSCSPSLLVQVLTNLIENGAHAAGEGGWVEVRGSSSGDTVMLEVTDSGPGVPMPLRERVFEPFYTTKDPGKGTGLGLSVARAIVARHGGVLEIRERSGLPAFVIEIPRKPIGVPNGAV